MPEDEGSFIRWQHYRIEQFSVVTNLLLGLGTGVLALEIPVGLGDKPPIGWPAALLAASASSLFLSVAVGLVLAWNRLEAFRLTAQLARERERKETKAADELRPQIDGLDKTSWRLLKWQTWLFAIGGGAAVALLFGQVCCGVAKSSPPPGLANNQMEHNDPTPSTPSPVSSVASRIDYQSLYYSAYNDYLKGNYDLAAREFQEYLANSPASDLADNAHYWIGEIYYRQKKHRAAIEKLDALLEQYPRSDKVASALLKKGYAHLELGERPQGVVQLRLLIRQYPVSDEASHARARLRELGDAG